MPGSVPRPTQIFHTTSIPNLGSIFSDGELQCHEQLAARTISPVDISLDNIQRRRARTQVPCGQGGNLHQYVPFFFNPKSPMLLYLTSGRFAPPIDRNSLVHLMSTVEQVESSGTDFVFTTGHAIMSYSDFYDDSTELNKVDWEIMASHMWNRTSDDQDRQCRREAEFLVHQSVDLSLVSHAIVYSQQAEHQVSTELSRSGTFLQVAIKPEMFY